MICIIIDNGNDNTVGGSCYSAHQAVGEFVEHHADMVSVQCQSPVSNGHFASVQ